MGSGTIWQAKPTSPAVMCSPHLLIFGSPLIIAGTLSALSLRTHFHFLNSVFLKISDCKLSRDRIGVGKDIWIAIWSPRPRHGLHWESLPQRPSIVSLIFHVIYYGKVVSFYYFQKGEMSVSCFEVIGLVGSFKVYPLSKSNRL